MAINIDTTRSRSPSTSLHSDQQEHLAKRTKTTTECSTAHETDGDVFSSEDIFKPHSASHLRAQYDHSVPYRHAIMKDIFNDRTLRRARDEITKELSFTLKETDIYKVLQTGDLANLDGLPEAEAQKLKSVKAVRDGLYSKQFRQLLNQVTSCGPLSGTKTDMSINNYRQGCHLLNHDDVIGTRRVSYILYLTDPDNSWEAEDGGALELYPVDSKTHHPLPTPSTKILPAWNQFVFFVVQPGESFHSVEEVFNLKKSRLSISGWFHWPQPGEEGYLEGQTIKEDEEKHLKSLGASLDQLKAKSEDLSLWTEVAFEPSSLTPDELQYLGEYLDSSYLKMQDLARLKTRFIKDSHFSLLGVLDHRFSCQLKHAILAHEAEDLLALERSSPNELYASGFHGPKFELGLQAETWSLVGPPHKHRYLTLPTDLETSTNKAQAKLLELKRLLESPAFFKWLTLVTTLVVTAYEVTPRRFRPGLDYTLATSNQIELLELHLSLTPSLGWEDGELGGWDSYMVPSEEVEADPAIWKPAGDNDEEGANLVTIYPGWNKLDLILRDPEVLTFTKYVSFNSPQSKWDIKAAYRVRET